MIEAGLGADERYQIIRRLGQGSFGRVFEALDRESGQRVAIKELTAVNAMALAQFKHEFRTVQEVHHPNLVRLDALFEDRGKWMIAMELVEGVDLLDYIYIEATHRYFDEHRLRDVFLQLAEGLMALHAAGVVHCDVKPNNMLITAEDRLVLLDFGLATGMDLNAQAFRQAGLGTLAYMAPEQLAKRPIGAAADWYAFGVCLFQALTGLLPIDGSGAPTVAAAKQQRTPARASKMAPGIPEDLDELCEALLQIAPEGRPGGHAIRTALGAARSLPWLTGKAGSIKPAAAGTDFAGRMHELDMLESALQQVEAGAPQVVLIEGESGIGKSALVEHFIDTQPGMLVLRSRCYESEQIAFKAFDQASYQLASHLCRVTRPEREALISERPTGLRILFPALDIVDCIGSAQSRSNVVDPALRRFEAFATFGRLLARIGRSQTLILAIDDLQWADGESFALLHSLLALYAPHALRCLVIATVRPPGELEGEARRGVEALRALPCVRTLRLDGLPPHYARALARRTIRGDVPDAWLESIVEESAGHPLFLTVLARFAVGRDPHVHSALTLDLAIAAQLGGLTRRARRLIDTVAVAGAPIAIGLCRNVARVHEADIGPIVTELCQKKLLRRRRAGQVTCFHDRIRRVAVGCLQPEEARKVHGKLAAVLAAQPNVDPAELARHLEGAGELEQAQGAYQRAADRAMSALAFARAARLYQRAIELARTLGASTNERRLLHVSRGHALAREGRSAEAACEYLEAGHRAPSDQRTELRIRAAQHLLQSACVQEGLAAAHELLTELELPVPDDAGLDRSDPAHCTGMAANAAPEIAGYRERTQLDALVSLSLPIAWLDADHGARLGAQHLRLAETLGEPAHLARALAEEAYAHAFEQPHRASVDQLLERARTLCNGSQDPELDVRVSYREGSIAAMRWDVPRALGRLEHAHRVARECCPEQPWLLTNIRLALGPLWFVTGEHNKLAQAMTQWLDEARDRNDRFAICLLEQVGAGHLRYLMADDPDRAHAALADAVAPWPQEPYSRVHFGHSIASAHNELYRGGAHALRWFEREQPRLAHGALISTTFCKAHVLTWHAQACIAACREQTPAESERLRTRAQDLAEQLAGLESRLSDLHSTLIRAQLVALQGDTATALPQLDAALQEAGQAGCQPIEHALRYLRGVIEGGNAGSERRTRAVGFFAAQGWKAPHRAVRMLCPALELLEPTR